jgi:hypothetical protein
MQKMFNVIMAYFKVIFQILHYGTEENHENLLAKFWKLDLPNMKQEY